MKKSEEIILKLLKKYGIEDIGILDILLEDFPIEFKNHLEKLRNDMDGKYDLFLQSKKKITESKELLREIAEKKMDGQTFLDKQKAMLDVTIKYGTSTDEQATNSLKNMATHQENIDNLELELQKNSIIHYYFNRTMVTEIIYTIKMIEEFMSTLIDCVITGTEYVKESEVKKYEDKLHRRKKSRI